MFGETEPQMPIVKPKEEKELQAPETENPEDNKKTLPRSEEPTFDEMDPFLEEERAQVKPKESEENPEKN